jgi:hypothetical protein
MFKTFAISPFSSNLIEISEFINEDEIHVYIDGGKHFDFITTLFSGKMYIKLNKVKFDNIGSSCFLFISSVEIDDVEGVEEVDDEEIKGFVNNQKFEECIDEYYKYQYTITYTMKGCNEQFVGFICTNNDFGEIYSDELGLCILSMTIKDFKKSIFKCIKPFDIINNNVIILNVDRKEFFYSYI